MEPTEQADPGKPERDPATRGSHPESSPPDTSGGTPAVEEDVGTEGAGTEPRTVADDPEAPGSAGKRDARDETRTRRNSGTGSGNP